MKMTRLEQWFVNREGKGQRNFEQVRAQLVALGVQPLCDVLELGCGIGVVSARLAETYGMRVWGVDLDPAQIRRAREAHGESERLGFRVGDATKLDFPDRSFDLVVAQNVFHHIPDWRVAVREMGRVVRPGGHVLWSDLAASPRVEPWLRRLGGLAGIYSRVSIRCAFRAAGLEPRLHSHSGRVFTRERMVLERVDERAPLWHRGVA